MSYIYVFKPLTKSELKHNKKFPERKIEPHTAFCINSEKFPQESQLWKALGFGHLQDIFKNKDNKTEANNE